MSSPTDYVRDQLVSERRDDLNNLISDKLTIDSKIKRAEMLYYEAGGCNDSKIDEESEINKKYCNLSGYSKLQEERNISESKRITNGWKEKLDLMLDEYKTLFNSIKSQNIYNDNLDNLSQNYYDRYQSNLKKLDKEYNEHKISHRMVSFYDSEEGNGLISFLKVLYGIVFICVLGVIIYKRLFTKWHTYLLLLIFILIPNGLLQTLTNLILKNISLKQIDSIYFALSILSLLVLCLFYVFIKNL